MSPAMAREVSINTLGTRHLVTQQHFNEDELAFARVLAPGLSVSDSASFGTEKNMWLVYDTVHTSVWTVCTPHLL